MNLLFRLLYTFLFSKFRSSVPLLGPCQTPFTVVPTDLDILRHMNNGKYLSILDVARVDLMIRSGLYKLLNDAGLYPVVVAETIRFKKSLEVFQKFEVETKVLGWDDKSFILSQDFKRNNQVIASAVIKARFLKKTGGSTVPADILKLADFTDPSPALPDWINEWNKSQSSLNSIT